MIAGHGVIAGMLKVNRTLIRVLRSIWIYTYFYSEKQRAGCDIYGFVEGMPVLMQADLDKGKAWLAQG